MNEIILHLETSSTVCSVAISEGKKVIANKEINDGYTHAENLHEFVSECVKECGISMKNLNAVAVSKGPGSYTGLRIGVSAAKGYAVALSIPLLSVNSLVVLSSQAKKISADSESLFVPMIDARREEVYSGLLDGDLNFLKETSAVILTEETTNFFPHNQPFYFFGSGAEKAKSYMDKYQAKFLPDIEASAIHMVEPAVKKFQNAEFEDVAYFEPFYLKEFFTTAIIRK